MLLNEAEQHTIIDMGLSLSSIDLNESETAVNLLLNRVADGDTYANPTDEFVRKTLAKRRLEAEIRKLNTRLADLDAQLVEEWTEAGRNKDGHAATGATLHLNRRVWAKLDVDTDGLPKVDAEQVRAGVKTQVAIALADAGLGHIVRSDFSLQTLSAIFAERIREYDEQQRMLPEHERVPKAPADFLPDELRGLLVIDATPHVQVRA